MVKLLSAGATAGLLPFALGSPAAGGPSILLPLASGPAAVVAGTSSGSGGVQSKPTPARRGPGGPGPDGPFGPLGNPGVSGGGIASGGGAASAFWCALLLGGLGYTVQELRRHRVRLILPEPAGVAFLLHRPG
jgi:hypothetical protein